MNILRQARAFLIQKRQLEEAEQKLVDKGIELEEALARQREELQAAAEAAGAKEAQAAMETGNVLYLGDLLDPDKVGNVQLDLGDYADMAGGNFTAEERQQLDSAKKDFAHHCAEALRVHFMQISEEVKKRLEEATHTTERNNKRRRFLTIFRRRLVDVH